MKGCRMHELGLAQAAVKNRDWNLAGELLEKVVSAQPSCDEAWFGLGQVALQLNDLESAYDFFQKACELEPRSAAYRCALGELLCRAGMLKAGVEELEVAFRLVPGDVNIACALSGAFVKAGLWSKARTILEGVCSNRYATAGHFCLKGMAEQRLGQLDQALVDFKTAARMSPGYTAAWHGLADIHRVRLDLKNATKCAEQALRLDPEGFDVVVTCGHIEAAKGNSRQASHHFRKACDLRPDSAEAWVHLGIALIYCGDSLPAIDALERAHQLGVAEDWIFEHMGLLFTKRGQLEAARENLELAVQGHPENLNAWNTLIVVYTKLGLADKARHAAETVLAINPRHVNALLNLGSWFSDQARNKEALEQYRKALAVNPLSATAYVNSLWVLVHTSEATAQDVLAMGREFDRHLCAEHRRTNSFNKKNRDTGRVLKIGWLTSDLRTHPVGAFVLPFLDKFDVRKVSNYVYYNFPGGDEVTTRCRNAVDYWRDVISLGDDELADAIEADDIDILIDLNGNTEGNRLLAVARKPAPVVVTWLGFPGTSGMSAVDYIFVPRDPVLESGGWCSETPWPLPACYGVRGGIPDVPILPGLPCERNAQPFTFGCLNNFRKVSKGTIRLWSEILQRVPDSRLVVVARGGADSTLLAYIHSQFSQYGIAPGRVDVRGIQPQLDYLMTYNEIDLGLDPFPFNGGTTGYDSIWMGVPYITLPGEMLVSRMGRAILKNVGLEELVVDDSDAYVATAVLLANDRSRLSALRCNLRERMARSPLMDGMAFARGLEQAFREMWLAWLR